MRYDLHLDLYDSTDSTVEPAPQLSMSMDASAEPNSEVLVAARLLVIGATTSNELWTGDVYDAARCRVIAGGVPIGEVTMHPHNGPRVTDHDHIWSAEAEGWELDLLPFLGEAAL